MSVKARELFDRRARQYGLDTSRGQFGEILNADTRTAWYFWFRAWQERAKDIRGKKRR